MVHRGLGRLAHDLSPRNPKEGWGSRGEKHAWVTETKDRTRGISEAKKRQKTAQWLGYNLEPDIKDQGIYPPPKKNPLKDLRVQPV
jgi:hypothetical protein